MPWWSGNECKRCRYEDAKVQKISQFIEGKAVGFTDAFFRLPSNWCKEGGDWAVAEEANKDGILVVQRFGRPETKISLHWHWVYLK